MAKPNHHSLAYKKRANPNKTYKDLKQKQKLRIAEMMYHETLRFHLENGRMPDEAECDAVCRKVYQKIESMAIWVPYDDVLKIYQRRQEKYAVRIAEEIRNGVTLESLSKPKKPPKSERPPKKRPKKKKKKKQMAEEPWQDDRFFFIAGYTSGGAPYGVTWEEMGLEPWQSLENLDEFQDENETDE